MEGFKPFINIKLMCYVGMELERMSSKLELESGRRSDSTYFSFNIQQKVERILTNHFLRHWSLIQEIIQSKYFQSRGISLRLRARFIYLLKKKKGFALEKTWKFLSKYVESSRKTNISHNFAGKNIQKLSVIRVANN